VFVARTTMTTRRPSALWYLVPVGCVLLGVAIAASILDDETERVDAAVAAFDRVDVPGDAVLELPAGDQVIYIEGPTTPEGPVEPRQLFIVSEQPGARPLEVRERAQFLSYSHRAGHSGQAALEVTVPEEGSYQVKLRFATDDVQALAFGSPLYERSLPPVRRAFAVALAGLAVGALGIVALAWRRHRSGARPARPATGAGLPEDLVARPRRTTGEDRAGASARWTLLRRWAFLLLLGTFALLPLQNLRLTAAVTLSDLTLVATAVVALLAGPPPGRRLGVPRGFVLGVGLLAAGLVVGLPFAGTLGASALVDLRLAVVVALTAWAVVRVAPSGEEVVRLLTTFTVVGGASGVLSALGAAAGIPFLGAFAFDGRAVGVALSSDSLLDAVRGTDAATALNHNPNLFGAIAAVGAVIGLVLLLDATDANRRWLLGAASAGLVLGVLFSGSRSALIAMAIGLVPSVWRLARRLSRQIALLAGAGLALLLIVGLLGVVRLPSVDRLLLRDDTTASARTAESTLDRYQSSSRGIEERGWHSFVTGSGLRNEPSAALHDGHLEIWLGLGMLGLVGWIVICGWTVRPAVLLVAVRGALDRRQLALLAVGSGFIANVAVMFFVDTVWNRYIWLLVALVLTLQLRPDGARPIRPLTPDASAVRAPSQVDGAPDVPVEVATG
jgi:hypothetical protein